MAEIKLAALANQCLADRVEDKQTLAAGIAAWEAQPNEKRVGCAWRFTTADARIRLERLSPPVHA